MGFFGNKFGKHVDNATLGTLRKEVIADFAKEAKSSQEYWSPFVSKTYDELADSDRKRVDQEVKLRLKGH